MLKISVILVIKNGEEYIKYLDNLFHLIESHYHNKYIFEYFIYENNSTDNTKNAIKNFYEHKNRLGNYLLEDIDINKDLNGINLERGNYMLFLRNKLKLFHSFLKSDYTLLLDADVLFPFDIIDKMINTFNEYNYLIGSSNENIKKIELPTICKSVNPIPSNNQENDWNDKFEVKINNNILSVKRVDSTSGWGQNLELKVKPSKYMVALTVFNICYTNSTIENNSIVNAHYYDSFAMITNKNISYKNNNNTCMFINCNRCKNNRKDNNINIDDSLLVPDNNIFNVNSAFGGFFLLKTYVYNNINWENTICEHHSFCDKIRNFGYILLDPKLKVITINSKNENYREIHQKFL